MNPPIGVGSGALVLDGAMTNANGDNDMTTRLHIAIVAAGVAATAAVFLTGPLTETRAATTEAERICAHAAMPYVPMFCIKGFTPTVDRIVTTDRGIDPYANGIASLNAR